MGRLPRREGPRITRSSSALSVQIHLSAPIAYESGRCVRSKCATDQYATGRILRSSRSSHTSSTTRPLEPGPPTRARRQAGRDPDRFWQHCLAQFWIEAHVRRCGEPFGRFSRPSKVARDHTRRRRCQLPHDRRWREFSCDARAVVVTDPPADVMPGDGGCVYSTRLSVANQGNLHVTASANVLRPTVPYEPCP
jgi:hypothetical protein